MDATNISRCSFVISINSYSVHYANCGTQKDANNMKNGVGPFLAAFTVLGNYPIRPKDASRLIPAWMLKTARHF